MSVGVEQLTQGIDKASRDLVSLARDRLAPLLLERAATAPTAEANADKATADTKASPAKGTGAKSRGGKAGKSIARAADPLIMLSYDDWYLDVPLSRIPHSRMLTAIMAWHWERPPVIRDLLPLTAAGVMERTGLAMRYVLRIRRDVNLGVSPITGRWTIARGEPGAS